MNESNSNNNINSIPTALGQQGNTIPTMPQQPVQNVVGQPQAQANQNVDNNNALQQQATNNDLTSDDDLLRSFIGKNYKKITTKKFNFAGFFFGASYLYYRKMIWLGVVVALLNAVISIVNSAATLIFNILVGLFANKIYLAYANKKIAKIKSTNSGKDMNDLKDICSSKGGTSVGMVFLGMIVAAAFMSLFNIDKLKNIVNSGSNSNNSSTAKGTLIEDVGISGHACIMSKCSVTIIDADNNSSEYVLNVNNSDLFTALGDYTDYIKLNIYYTEKGDEKTIVNYKMYLKSNNEEINNIKTENELRDKLGLYSVGTHTGAFTLTKKGMPGIGYDNGTKYTYIDCTFVDDKGIEFEMEYTNPDNTVNLVEGTKYNITFEVTEGTFEYDFKIKEIK